MKKWILFGIAGMLLLAFSGLQAATLDEALKASMNSLTTGETLQALVTMKTQADIKALDLQLKAEHATLAERNRRVIIALQDAASQSQPEMATKLERLKKLGAVKDYHLFWVANMFWVETNKAGIETLATDQTVEALYLDYPIETIAPVKSEPADNIILSHERGLDRINAPAAWANGWTGRGRVVMNIDTGVEGTHPALSARFRGDVNNDGNVSESWFDPYSNYPRPRDLAGHGTHTMGTMCGRSVAGDTVGVAIEAKWIAAGAIDRGGGIPRTVADAIRSFQWAVDPDNDPNTQDNPDAIGNSWGVTGSMGYPPCDSTFWQVIDNCEAAGSAVVFSAGNEGPGPSSLRTPADRGTTPYNCFSVGAVDGSNNNLPIASWSSRGPSNCGPNGETVIKPEVVAPGVNIRSSYPGGGYQYMDGTSMASPHVTGSIAVIRQVNPNLTVDAIKEILLRTAQDLPLNNPNGEDNTYGWGIIDLYAACQMAQSGFGFVDGYVVDTANNPIRNALINVTGYATHDNSDQNGYYYIGLPADTTYTLNISSFGYFPLDTTAAIVANETTHVNITLQTAPFGSLHGTVIASDSTPVTGAVVKLLNTPLDSVLTNSSGYYEFLLVPGNNSYDVEVRAGGFGRGSGNIFVPVGGQIELNFTLTRFESFEQNNGGWTGSGCWAWGRPTSGPNSAYDGTNVWATVLGGNYPINADDNLITGFYVIDTLPAILNFYHWYDFEATYDGGNISISTDGGNTWNLIVPEGGYPDNDVVGLDNQPGYSASTSGWTLAQFRLADYIGMTVKFRFRFGSDSSINRAGWYLDAVLLQGGSSQEAGTPDISIDPSFFNVRLNPGSNTTRNMTLHNSGNGPLVYSIATILDGALGTGKVSPIQKTTSDMPPNWSKYISHSRTADKFRVTYNGPKPYLPDNNFNPPMALDFGGPDAFGYRWIDSNEPQGPAFNWVDITGIGQQLTFDDDDNQGPFDLGFDFSFYDNPFNSIRICSNGWVSFTSTSPTPYTNASIPTAAQPNNLIAPFWDDLNPSSTGGGSIYFYTNNTDTAIVSYVGVPKYLNTGSFTFEVVLTSNGHIVYQYGTMDGDVTSSTVGIENGDGTVGLQVVNNASYLTNNLAVKISAPPQWLSTNPVSGSVPANESANITVTFDAANLQDGVFSGLLRIDSNDPDSPSMTVPCSLIVGTTGINDDFGALPTTYNLMQNYPNPFNPTTEINFALPHGSVVNIDVYDVLGRQIKNLASARMEAGRHSVIWDGKDNSGNSVTSGIYFYKLKTDDYQESRKMVLLK